MKRIAALIVCVLALVPLAANAGDVVDRIVAVVNDDVILLSELQQSAKPFIARATANVKNRAQKAEARRQVLDRVLDQMVSDQLVEQEARALGIVVTDREVDADLQSIKDRNGMSDQQMMAQLKQQGMTLERLREDLRSQRKRLKLIEFKVKPRVSVSEDQIHDYYDKNFKTDDQVTVSVIVYNVPPAATDAEVKAAMDKAAAARKRIVKGEATFSDVAAAESEGPNPDKGGLLGSFRRGEMVPAFERVVFDLDEGEVSEPVVIDTDRGQTVNVFLVSDREQKAARDYKDEHDRIYNLLFSQAAEKEYTRWVDELRQKGFVDVRLDGPLKR